MASRIEKTTRRVAGRVRKATKTAATATRHASKVLDNLERATRGIDSRRAVKKASKVVNNVAKSAAVGAMATGLRRAVDAAGTKLSKVRKRKPSRGKKALKVAGAVAAVAGAAVLTSRAVKSRRARTAASNTSTESMEPESEMERGPEY